MKPTTLSAEDLYAELMGKLYLTAGAGVICHSRKDMPRVRDLLLSLRMLTDLSDHALLAECERRFRTVKP